MSSGAASTLLPFWLVENGRMTTEVDRLAFVRRDTGTVEQKPK